MEASRYIYRAKLKNWKETGLKAWTYGAYYKFLDYTPYPVNTKHIPESDYKHLIVHSSFSDWGLPRELTVDHIDPSTLCQCIGFNDSKGNPIFEGDIVRYSFDSGELAEYKYATVEWGQQYEYPAFDLDKTELFDCNALSHIFNCEYTIEVVGNKVDNNDGSEK